MAFGWAHYVPVLKCKAGEKKALALLSAAVWERITPLIEVVELKKGKTLDEHFNNALKGLDGAIPTGRAFFFDPVEVSNVEANAAARIFAEVEKKRLAFIPVAGLCRPKTQIVAAIDHAANGLCLRLTREELEAGQLSRGIARFLEENRLAPETIDLVMDMGEVGKLVLAGVRALAEAFLQAVPEVERWRTFTLAGSAFPQSMRMVPPGGQIKVSRLEWVAWRDSILPHRGLVPRMPTFSDCGIQHPSGVEGFDFKTMQVSPTIRYTSGDQWLLVKGSGTRKGGKPTVQFPRLAVALAGGSFGSFFSGAGHCRGCDDIVSCARGTSGFGSAGAWRRIGTVHHITTVVEQIRRLPVP